jgi:hypothetical protein
MSLAFYLIGFLPQMKRRAGNDRSDLRRIITFLGIGPGVTYLLMLIMFGMGVTLNIDDFKRVLVRHHHVGGCPAGHAADQNHPGGQIRRHLEQFRQRPGAST